MRTNLYEGLTIGNITLLHSNIEDARTFWSCKCICGKIVIRRSDYLASNRGSNSCGCITKNKIRGSKCKKWKGQGKLGAELYHSYKSKAKKRNLEFNITIEFMWELLEKQNFKCAFTGLPLILFESQRIRQASNLEQTASLDRIDSTKGYTIDNVHWVHKHINMMKHKYSKEHFIAMCKLVASNN